MIAKEDGSIIVLNTDESVADKVVTKYNVHQNCIFDIQWLGSKQFLTCSGDSTIQLNDLNSQNIVTKFTGHTGSVRSISLRPNYFSFFASSSRDGSILLWDQRLSTRPLINVSIYNHCKPLKSLLYAHDNNLEAKSLTQLQKKKSVSPKPVTCVSFVNDNILASSGASDGRIKFWDIRKIQKIDPTPVRCLEYSGNTKHLCGITDLVVNSTGNKLFSYCRDGFIYQYDLMLPENNNPQFRYTGHTSESFYLKLDINYYETHIVCGSSSNSPYIYQINEVPQQPLLLNGHSSEITVCRWSPSDPGVVLSLSDDCTYMIHRMKPSHSSSQWNCDTQLKNKNNSQTCSDLISISSRYGVYTVTEKNQLFFNKSNSIITSPYLSTPIIKPNLSTPIKSKTPKIVTYLSPEIRKNSSFLQPVISSYSSNSSTRTILGDLNGQHQNTHSQQTTNISQYKVDRTKSMIDVKSNKIQLKNPINTMNTNNNLSVKRKRPLNDENDENSTSNAPKRQRSVYQVPITRFLH